MQAASDLPLPGRVRRGGPGMPLEFDDPDGDGVLRPTRDRFGKPKGPWWRPTSTTGRVFLVVGALLVLGSFTTSIVLFTRYLERDSRFRIAGSENIEASGLTEVSRAEMLPVFGEDIGRNVFFVPLAQRRKQLEQIAWIQHATVMRLLPDRIRINVVERQPVAFTRHGQQIGLVDADGVLLAMAPASMARHHYSFPVVTGIDPGDPAGARKGRMAMYQRMMAELDAGGKHNSQQISEIDLTDPEDARVLMPEQGADILAHFGEDHFLERYERYQAHIAEWRQQYPQLAAVDLRYDDQVVLQMASGKETSTSSAAVDQPAAAATLAPATSKTKSKVKPSPTKPSAKKSNPAPTRKPAAQEKKVATPSKPSPIKRSSASTSRPAAPGEQGG
jgi:cell division protein FtsQ